MEVLLLPCILSPALAGQLLAGPLKGRSHAPRLHSSGSQGKNPRQGAGLLRERRHPPWTGPAYSTNCACAPNSGSLCLEF